MGTGVSMSEKQLQEQEAFVRKNFTNAKQCMSQYKRDDINRYNDTQIKMKLRQEYYKSPYNNKSNDNNNYIANSDWKNYRNSQKYRLLH
jgi:hypothetical protein